MAAPLVFGVFPLGMAGGPGGLAVGPPDDFDAIGQAVTELQGDGRPLLPRMYVVWSGPASTDPVLGQVAQLAGIGVPLDLALCYRDPGGDVPAWASFVSQVVARHGHELAAVQV